MDRADRPRFGELQGPLLGFRINQMFQHPPLPYIAGAVLLVSVDGVADVEAMPADRFAGILRLANVLVLALLPLLLVGTARRLGGGQATQLVAALLPLAVPQLWYVSGSVGNDGWMVVAAALATFVFAGVVTGDASVRQAGWFGVALGGAALVKAFALALFALPVLAYIFLARQGRLRWRAAGGRMLAVSAIAMAVGGWWWVWNLVQYGTVQPQGSPVARLEPAPTFRPQDLAYWTKFTSWMVTRFWGWFGGFAAGIRLPVVVVVVATLVGVALITLCLVDSTPQRRWFALSGVVVHLVLLVHVAHAARGLYVDNGVLQGIQGRYLYAALPALVVTAAIGAESLSTRLHADARWTVASAFGAGVAMQITATKVVLDGWWGEAPGDLLSGARSIGAWAPWPPQILVPSLTLLAAGAIWGLAGTFTRTPAERRPRPSRRPPAIRPWPPRAACPPAADEAARHP
jgi:4-amino-4-deoxy-L-arabinose transferase-like glycosyltransferase